MTVAHMEIPEAEITRICQRNGIRKLALFGSVLTDRFSESSDVDVLVEFHQNAHIGFFRLADIEDELSRLFAGRRVDLRTPMDLSRHFREQVVRDSLAVYVKSCRHPAPAHAGGHHARHEDGSCADRTELTNDPMLAREGPQTARGSERGGW